MPEPTTGDETVPVPVTPPVVMVDAPVVTPVVTLMEATKVTSPPGKSNWRDRVLAFLSSFAVAILGLITTLWSLVASIIDSVADYVLPYLQSVPQHNKPIWLAAVTFLLMGLIILQKRKTAGPNYVPPMAARPLDPDEPVPQVQPLPPGTPVDMSKSAF